jgi:MFS family permease
LIALVSVRTAILISVIPGLLATLSIIYAIRVTPRPSRRDRVPIRLRVRPVLQAGLSRLFVAIALFECGNLAATLLILRATDLLTSDHSQHRAASLALVLYIAYNAAAALISLPAGHLGDKRGFTRVLAVGAAAFAVAFFGLAAGGSLLVLGVWFIAAGVGIACVETAQHAVVATNAPPDVRGSAFGLLAGVQSLGNFIASALAGLLWTVFSPEVAFVYAACCKLAALLVFARPTFRRPASADVA